MNHIQDDKKQKISTSRNLKRRNVFNNQHDYLKAKNEKLKKQFQDYSNEDKSLPDSVKNIFTGVSFHINGYTNPPFAELRRLILKHGGSYHQIYSKTKTTYMIATNLPPRKVEDMRHHKVIKPQFILDCINEKKLLSPDQYFSYTHLDKGQSLLKFEKDTLNNSKQEDLNTKIKDPENMSHNNDQPLFIFDSVDSTFTQLENNIMSDTSESIKNELFSGDSILSDYASNQMLPLNDTSKIVIPNVTKKNKIKKRKPTSSSNIVGPMDRFLKKKEKIDLTCNRNEVDPGCNIPIIRNWIAGDEDQIDHIFSKTLSYFINLVETKQYKKMEIIFKNFYSLIEGRSSKWKNAYNQLISSINYELKQDGCNTEIILPIFTKIL